MANVNLHKSTIDAATLAHKVEVEDVKRVRRETIERVRGGEEVTGLQSRVAAANERAERAEGELEVRKAQKKIGEVENAEWGAKVMRAKTSMKVALDANVSLGGFMLDIARELEGEVP